MAGEGQSQPLERDDREPGERRKAELEAAYQQNMAQEKSPYTGVEIRTYGELLWIFEQRGWSVAAQLPGGKARPDLNGASFLTAKLDEADLTEAQLNGANFRYARMRGAYLVRAQLSGAEFGGALLNAASLVNAQLDHADLSNAQLSGADLFQARLNGAKLRGANLSAAHLTGAQLQETDLRFAKLDGAELIWARLDGADLNLAHLDGTNFSEAHLANVDLTYSVMNSQTALDSVILSSGTRLGDIKWNGVYLTRINWNQIDRLGDERAIADAADRKARIAAYRDAARAYRGLRIELKNQGLLLPASRFRLRERQLERQVLLAERRVFPWFGSWILDLVSGYGERPGRIFGAYVIVVMSFAALYWGMSNFFQTVTQPLRWYEALVLSLSSFHGRGFFPSAISLGDPLAIIAAVEAVIGLFIELLLIATFSRRFLGD